MARSDVVPIATDILRGEVETEAIWTQDVVRLSEVSAFNVIESGDGSYYLEQSLVI